MATPEQNGPFSNPNRLGVVAGLFHDASDTDRALAELRRRGFSDSQMDLEQGAAPANEINGGLLGNLGRLLGIARGKYQDFVDDASGRGLTEDQAFWLEKHFKNGDEILVVNAGDRAQEAFDVLRQSGAEVHIGTGQSTIPPASALDIDLPGESEKAGRQVP